MAIVTFWSKTEKETAQTLSMIAIATHIAVEKNSRILIIDTNIHDATIKDAYWPEKENAAKKVAKQLSAGKLDIGSGIEGLSKLLISGKTSGDIISDYSKVVFKGRLETILSFMGEVPEDIQRVQSTYKDLIRLANQQYDYVFVDVPKGLNNQLVREILGLSDVIVYNITQRLRDMEDYIQLKQNDTEFKKNKILPLIGRYDRFSKYTKKNIARYIGESKDIPAVSYNTLFFESAGEGGIGEYFLKFRKSLISSQDRNAMFIEEVGNAADRIEFKVQEVLMAR